MENIISVIDTYGWAGVFMVVILVIFGLGAQYIVHYLFKNVKSDLEKIGERLIEHLKIENEMLTKVIVEQQDKMIKHLLDEKQKEVERHNNMIYEKEDLAVNINNYLKVIMKVHNSQRAYILEFHNHNENLSGTPFVKFTCKYEWFDLDGKYDPLLGTCKDMAFASIAQIAKDVRTSENQCVLYNNIDDFNNNNPSISYYITTDKTKAFIFKGLYDKNNTFIALLVLEFNYYLTLKDVNLNKLNVQAAEITQLINLRYKYSE